MKPDLPRWAVSPPQILFDDEHLRVVFRPGGSDWLLVTVGDATTPADGKSFHAQTIVEKQGLNCLGFMAKGANWYQARWAVGDFCCRVRNVRLKDPGNCQAWGT